MSAQCFQESSHRPEAVSPAGARGLCQIMPPTWAEETERLGIRGASPFNPKANAIIGAAYMARMFAFWSAPRPRHERRRLAQASYNAGAGNILQAQRLCDGARDWGDVAPCLEEVTGRHSRETIGYVERIAGYFADLHACP